ncbi:NADH-quinone oxidoreductase subunit J [Demequina sp.]|uniref:NADH-quinone oxidoreductase subunit J n=1 Tax=Demequina sp. TaxID=2050685 RepID=UPI003D09930A
MVNPFLFWVVAAITVLPSLALLFARKAVHVAMGVVFAMLGLAVAYIMLAAPFLGMVQIVVYTGAIMMMFVFVLMLIGVKGKESLRESIVGQRWIGILVAVGTGLFLWGVVSRVSFNLRGATEGNPAEIAGALFGRFVVVMETLGFVLIVAAVGALVLTHMPRLVPKHSQKEIAEDRIRVGANPVNKPMPGVYARHNALDVPALGPDGKPIEESISRVLEVRHQMDDQDPYRADKAIEEGDDK